MESVYNHSKLGVDQNGDFCEVMFAYIGVKDAMIRQGKKVEELKPSILNKSVATEEGFRMFLLRIVSMEFDREKLTKEDNKVINSITSYLSEPIEQPEI